MPPLLGVGCGRAVSDARDDVGGEACPVFGEHFEGDIGGGAGGNVHRAHGEHVTGVQCRHELEHAGAEFGVSGDQRALDRRRPPPLRQQRSAG